MIIVKIWGAPWPGGWPKTPDGDGDLADELVILGASQLHERTSAKPIEHFLSWGAPCFTGLSQIVRDPG